jgi:hypothetical protein
VSERRQVTMTLEQAREIDRYIELLMRANRNERAKTMMMLRLQFYDAPVVRAPLPDNVVELHGHSRKVTA